MGIYSGLQIARIIKDMIFYFSPKHKKLAFYTSLSVYSNYLVITFHIPYFFAYKTVFFPSETIPKIQIRRSLGLFRKGKTCITGKLHRTDLIICTHSREGKPRLIAE